MFFQPKQDSKPYLLQHGDLLTIGSTTFLLHIHRGMSCCTECSQLGIVVGSGMSDETNTDSLETQRRKELNKIKKKYGLRVRLNRKVICKSIRLNRKVIM